MGGIRPTKSRDTRSSFQHHRNSTSNSDPTSSILNERETRFVSGMEGDQTDRDPIFEPQPGNFG